MSKRAFTLVEMLVVIMVIGLLLGLVIFSGWKNVTEIEFRSDKETFLSTFTKIRNNALSSNYFKDTKYDSLEIQYDDDNNTLNTKYIIDGSNNDLQPIYLTNSYFSGNDSFKIIFLPYSVGCDFVSLDSNLSNNGNNLIQLVSKNGKYAYCFNLDLTACRLKEIQCLNVK
ncbi:MAG: type II secretion system protein [Candidatus Absconditabacteria bacterium]